MPAVRAPIMCPLKNTMPGQEDMRFATRAVLAARLDTKDTTAYQGEVRREATWGGDRGALLDHSRVG